MRRRCRASRSESSAVHVSREVSKLLPACLYRPFSKYLAERERSVYPSDRRRPTDAARPNRLRWGDYTRGAPASQLDDGIGDALVLGPVEQSAAPLRRDL